MLIKCQELLSIKKISIIIVRMTKRRPLKVINSCFYFDPCFRKKPQMRTKELNHLDDALKQFYLNYD